MCYGGRYSYRPYEASYIGVKYDRYAEGHYNITEYDHLPTPRNVSNYVVAYTPKMKRDAEARRNESAPYYCQIIPNSRGGSSWWWQWGQFIDHIIALTHAGNQNGQMEWDVTCDQHMDPMCNGKKVHVGRSHYMEDHHGHRQQINDLTPFIDASTVYGSTYERYHALRAYKYGLMKTTQHGEHEFMPYNTAGLENAGPGKEEEKFLGGDIRANEQLGLAVTHTLWVREHNWWARKLYKQHPDWCDEQLYWTARSIVTGEIQAITYNEFLPALLGDYADPKYYDAYGPHATYSMPPAKYDEKVSAKLTNTFGAAAFRFGHSLVSNALYIRHYGTYARYYKQEERHECLPLHETYFNPQLVIDYGLESVLLGLSYQPCEEVDTKVVEALRNFLHFAEVFDLASLNIARGRDHGLPYYHELRKAVTGHEIYGWEDITHDHELIYGLKSVYGGKDGWKYIDAWVGILAEDHLSGSSMGITGTTILIDQFKRMRDADAYFYLWDKGMCEEHRKAVHQTTLYDVIVRNTKLTDDDFTHHKNLFFVPH